MEEIIQILIFVGAMVIAAIGQNTRNKKKPKNASPQEVLEDVFPEITLQGEDKVISQIQQPVSIHKKTPKKKFSAPMNDSSNSQKEPPKAEKKINLNSREKARKAFIYSEIFNRKY